MPGQIHPEDGIFGSLLAKLIEQVEPGPAKETNCQMHGMPTRNGSRMGVAPRNEQDISRCHLDLVVLRPRIDVQPIGPNGMWHLRIPDAPSLVAVNLHDQDVMNVPMRLERAPLGETQICIHLSADSHFSLDACCKLAD